MSPKSPKRKIPAMTPKVFALQYQSMLLQGLKKPVDLLIDDKGEDEVQSTLAKLLEQEEWDVDTLLQVSALTFTMAVIANITGESYEADDDENDDDEDDNEG